MGRSVLPPIGVSLSVDVEPRGDRFRARVRWVDPVSKRRKSCSTTVDSVLAGEEWATDLQRAVAGGVDPGAALLPLREFGESVMTLALRGLEPKTNELY